MNITIQLTEQEHHDALTYAKSHGLSVEDAMKTAFFGLIEESINSAKDAADMDQWNSGQGTRLSKEFLEEPNTEVEDSLKLAFTDYQRFPTPENKGRKSIRQRFAAYEGPVKLAEEWVSDPVGNEVW